MRLMSITHFVTQNSASYNATEMNGVILWNDRGPESLLMRWDSPYWIEWWDESGVGAYLPVNWEFCVRAT
jgi:hypothetical protein